MKETTIYIRISENLKKEFSKHCQKKGVSMSEEVRNLIEDEIINQSLKEKADEIENALIDDIISNIRKDISDLIDKANYNKKPPPSKGE